MTGRLAFKLQLFQIRLMHWEYWSFTAVYFLIYPVFIFLCLRARSFFFFAAANPTIKNGGFLGESKKEIYQLVPPGLQPKTIFFDAFSDPQETIALLAEAGFNYPLIGKPDIGGRGRGIEKLESKQAVAEYVSNAQLDFHIQEFIDYELEAGIFYYRYPGTLKGNISGIVDKQFLKVKGNGTQTIRELLLLNPRAMLQLPVLDETQSLFLRQIPAQGKIQTVVPYGNHARGALFLDHSNTINQPLIDAVDEVCRSIPFFYFGRLDIKYKSRALLEAGKCFSVIEVNGAGSEPTHIYDPRHSILFAWKEIIRHWILLFRISRANHRLGHRYLSVQEGMAMFKKDKADSRLLDAMSKS